METQKRISFMFFLIIIFCIITVLGVKYFLGAQSRQINRMTTALLWEQQTKTMSEPHSEYNVITSIQGETPGISYTFNMNITEWIYNSDVQYREVLTHGIGNFGDLKASDILSVAIDAHKNNLYIDVNTLYSSSKGCTTEVADDTTTEIRVERITLKYFPISKYFHVALVLTQNRVDAYLDGKLNVTRILKGDIFDQTREDTLPLKFFQGELINGSVSNFRYFNTELSSSYVNKIYLHGKDPTKNRDIAYEETTSSCDT